jgi:hypothetical protein
MGFVHGNVARLDKTNVHGIVIGGSFAQKRWLRWTAELAAQEGESGFAKITPPEIPITFGLLQSSGQFQGGPEFTKYSHRATLFTHVLFGYAFWELDPPKSGDFHGRESGFSIAAGGGMDFRIIRRIGARLAVDYIPTFNRNNTDEFYATYATPGVPPSKNVFRILRFTISPAVIGRK